MARVTSCPSITTVPARPAARVPRDVGHDGLVVQVDAAVDGAPGDGAIHRARVHVPALQCFRDGTRHRSLARARRAVDCDQHRATGYAPSAAVAGCRIGGRPAVHRPSPQCAVVAGMPRQRLGIPASPFSSRAEARPPTMAACASRCLAAGAVVVLLLVGWSACRRAVTGARCRCSCAWARCRAGRRARRRLADDDGRRVMLSFTGAARRTRRASLPPPARPHAPHPAQRRRACARHRGAAPDRLRGGARDVRHARRSRRRCPISRQYLVTTRLTDDIEDAALAMLAAPEVPQDRRRPHRPARISFAGGLSVIAAGRPSLRDRVGFVFSVGGHARLPGVMQYVCTGRQPDGRMHPPHEYGAVILLTNMAEDVVPPDQVAPLRAAVHQFLHASHVDMFDKPQAAIEFPGPRHGSRPAAGARAFMRLVNDRDALGPRRPAAAVPRSLGHRGRALARRCHPPRAPRSS